MHWFLLLVLTGCSRAVPTQLHSASEPSTQHLLWDEAGPIVLESVVSATWEVPLSGLLDLTDPAAAHFDDKPFPIVIPVHVLTHPEHGTFIVDTGISQARARGEKDAARGLIAQFVKNAVPVEPLGDILARQAGPLAGVLLTHTHLDHVLGLQDVPAGVPIYGGPGEGAPHGLRDRFVQPTIRRAFDGRSLQVWDVDSGMAIGPVNSALDVLGDGSLWALSSPGHTEGSMAYLAFTTTGPALFVGDTSHTQWGWDHSVLPGTYTVDAESNRDSLTQLKALVEAHPSIAVFVGHEL
ncbi:MAG: N-acyl homoserine lactone hydrolase [Myxococcota bacterium]|jgi:N-acyl homoserine lactone hydrolase